MLTGQNTTHALLYLTMREKKYDYFFFFIFSTFSLFYVYTGELQRLLFEGDEITINVVIDTFLEVIDLCKEFTVDLR